MKSSGNRSAGIALFILLLFAAIVSAGCGGGRSTEASGQEDGNSVIKLKAFTMGTEPETGMEEFYQQLDALTVRDLNCRVRFDFVPWSEDKSAIWQKIYSGEYDLYVGGNFSDFTSMVNKNVFLDMKPYLKDVPDLAEKYRLTGEDLLESFEIDGKLYGIPGIDIDRPVSTTAFGFLYREDLRKKWDLPPVTDIDTMEQYLYRAKDDPEYKNSVSILDSRFWTSLWKLLAGDKYMEINSSEDTPWIVVSYDDPYKVVNRYETAEYKKVIEYAQKWYRDGIVSEDILERPGNTTEEEAKQMIAGKRIASMTMGTWTMDDMVVSPSYELHPDWQYRYLEYGDITEKTVYKSSNAGNTCTSINERCMYPETAMRFIEKAHTDRDYYMLLHYGVDGKHYYLKDSKVTTEGIPEKNIFSGWTGLQDGYLDVEDTGSLDPDWQEFMDRKEENGVWAKDYSPLYGFLVSMDEDTESPYYARMKRVNDQYYTPLQCGIVNNLDEDLERANRKMREAGLDRYIDDVQKKLTKFKKNKEKSK